MFPLKLRQMYYYDMFVPLRTTFVYIMWYYVFMLDIRVTVRPSYARMSLFCFCSITTVLCS